MEIENVKEYEYIRSETELIRNCITTYMGYVIGGSGAAMFGLAALRAVGAENRIVVAFVSFATSILVSLVLAILFYKFNSHNRYAAYSLVLADETYATRPATDKPHEAMHVAWELCMERIRVADRRPAMFRQLAESSFFAQTNDPVAVALYGWMLDEYLPWKNGAARMDHHKFTRGFKHLMLALTGRTRTTSWAFPPPVVAVFFILVLAYLGIGIYETATHAVDHWRSLAVIDAKDTPFLALAICGVAALALQCVVWRILCAKLFALMAGSATVDAFAFRFAIARGIYLHRAGVVPRYRSIELLLQEEKERLEQQAARENHRAAA